LDSASEHRPQQAVDTASVFVIQRVVEGGGHQTVAIRQSQNACVGYRSEDFRDSAGEELYGVHGSAVEFDIFIIFWFPQKLSDINEAAKVIVRGESKWSE